MSSILLMWGEEISRYCKAFNYHYSRLFDRFLDRSNPKQYHRLTLGANFVMEITAECSLSNLVNGWLIEVADTDARHPAEWAELDEQLATTQSRISNLDCF